MASFTHRDTHSRAAEKSYTCFSVGKWIPAVTVLFQRGGTPGACLRGDNSLRQACEPVKLLGARIMLYLSP